MRRHTEYNNIILLTVNLKFFGVVAIVAIKDKQPIFALHTRYYIEIEVLNPIHTFLINNPPIIGYYNTPKGRKVTLLIPISKVVLPSQDNKW